MWYLAFPLHGKLGWDQTTEKREVTAQRKKGELAQDRKQDVEWETAGREAPLKHHCWKKHWLISKT